MLIPILLSLFGGLLYVFSFAPWDQSYLAWIAFIPLFFAMDRLPETKKTWKTHFLLGLSYSIVIAAGGFYWIVYATGQYGGLPLWACILLFLAFCLTGQLQVPLYLCLRRQFLKFAPLSNRLIFRSLIFGILYAGIEASFPKLFEDTFGNAFSHSLWLRQAADLGGAFFLTLLLIASNELLYAAWKSKRIPSAMAGLLIPLFCLGYGAYRVSEYENLYQKQNGAPELKLALIQANIGDYLKVAAENGVYSAANQVIDQYLSLSTKALEDPTIDGIVWPETAYPAIFAHPLSDVENQMDQKLKNFTLSMKASFLFGGYDADSKGLEYNSILFLDPLGQKRGVYHKSILLQFGETLPFAETFPSMKSWFPTMGFFGQGPGALLYEVKNKKGDRFKVAPSICYEGLFPSHSSDGANQGADLLLNVTNDSWFGPKGEPDLHLALTIFRSIETRLPMLRSTNTGYTVAIDPLGTITQSTPLSQSAILNASIRPRTMPKPFFLLMAEHFGGRWFERLLEGLLLVALVFISLKRKHCTT